MKIQVTQDHIDRGMQGDCADCPIALAIKEQLKPFLVAVYSVDIIVFKSPSQGTSYKHTKESIQFISKFDRGDLYLGVRPC
jgi:hypothetical protein